MGGTTNGPERNRYPDSTLSQVYSISGEAVTDARDFRGGHYTRGNLDFAAPVQFHLGAMRRSIKDEFTHLPVSRQRKYQLRMQRDSRCTECGEPAEMGSRCLKHLVIARERQRKKMGLKRRHYATLSYQLQSDPKAMAKRAKAIKAAQGKKS